MGVRALELFCGVGGFAAAVAGWNVQVVKAVDQNGSALAVYRLNFPHHPACCRDLERITAAELAAFRADLWWMSPPCQPYSVRGTGRDLDDPRARSLARLMEIISGMSAEELPDHLALENVAGFARSRAHDSLVPILEGHGYSLREHLLCPTELGVPSRRPRYYLIASRRPLAKPAPPLPPTHRRLADYLLPAGPEFPAHELYPDPGLLERFGAGFRIIDPGQADAYTTCFTGSYGKSLMHAGSYLRCGDRVRRFHPDEIARLLHFPDNFRFPGGMSLRTRWRLLGNSLSVAAVRQVLSALPDLASPVP